MKREKYLYDPRVVEDYSTKISGVGVNNGEIYFEMTPGTAPASANGMYICEFLAPTSTSVFIRLAFSGASSVTLTYADGKGNTSTDSYNVTSTLASGTSYQNRIRWTPGFIDWAVDGTVVADIAADVVWEHEPPTLAYWGIASGGSGTYTSTTFSYPTTDTYRY